MYTIEELKDRLLSDLKEIAEELNVGNFKKLSKQDLIYKILDQQPTVVHCQQHRATPRSRRGGIQHGDFRTKLREW